MIYTHNVTNNYKLHMVDSTLESPFTLEEKKQLIQEYQIFVGAPLQGERHIRLEKIVTDGDCTHIYTSKLDFEDLLANDIVPMHLNAFKSFLVANGTQLSVRTLDKLDKLRRLRDRISCFQDIYENNYLSRAIVLSAAVTDGKKCVIAKGNTNPSTEKIRSGMSVTGVVRFVDALTGAQQFESVITSKVMHQLFLCTSLSAVKITSISYDSAKLQPTITAVVSVPEVNKLKSSVFNTLQNVTEFTTGKSKHAFLSADEIKILFDECTSTELCRSQLKELQLL